MLTAYTVFIKDETTKNFKCVWLHACTNNEVLNVEHGMILRRNYSRSLTSDDRACGEIWYFYVGIVVQKIMVQSSRNGSK